MSVGDWSTNADANTLVGSVFIGENCPSKNLNNAIRQVMSEARAKFDQIDAATAILAGFSTDVLNLLNADNQTQMRAAMSAAASTDFLSGSNGNGFWSRIPDGAGGFIITQWGVRVAGNNTWSPDYGFPIPFIGGMESIVVTPGPDFVFSSLDGNAVGARASLTSPKTAFNLGGSDNPYTCFWQAVGR